MIRVALVIVGLLLCAWRFGSATIAAENIRANGTEVLFPLAPVDPRALLLGDYMTLRYDFGQNTHDERDGIAVIRVEDKVGQIVRFGDVDDLAFDERLLRYSTNRRGQVTIGGEAYYFQSGTGERFEAAEYGIFRLMPDGRVLLSGLADTKKRPILIAGEAPLKTGDDTNP